MYSDLLTYLVLRSDFEIELREFEYNLEAKTQDLEVFARTISKN